MWELWEICGHISYLIDFELYDSFGIILLTLEIIVLSLKFVPLSSVFLGALGGLRVLGTLVMR